MSTAPLITFSDQLRITVNHKRLRHSKFSKGFWKSYSADQGEESSMRTALRTRRLSAWFQISFVDFVAFAARWSNGLTRRKDSGCCHQVGLIGWAASGRCTRCIRTQSIIRYLVRYGEPVEFLNSWGHVITSTNSRYETGCGILDPLKRGDCRLWKTGKHRVAVV